MTAITAVVNQKGGVGKTLVVGNLGHALAELGVKTLLVDNDPQANLTKHFLHVDDVIDTPTLADVLDRRHPAQLEQAILPTDTPHLFIVPSGGGGLQQVQESLLGQPGADRGLQIALGQLDPGEWGHVLIDCRPATDVVTRNALLAASQAVVVVQPELDALQGWTQTQEAIGDLETYLGHVLPVRGVVINQVDYRRGDHSENLEYIRQAAAELDLAILGDPVPMTTDLSRLAAVGMGIGQLSAPSARLRTIATSFRTVAEALHEGVAA